MVMDYVERKFRSSGDNDLALRVRSVEKAFEKRHPGSGDIAFPSENTLTGEAKATDPKSQDLLNQAIYEYIRGARTPEVVTAYWQNKLIVDGGRVGFQIEVPPCDWTGNEIRRPMLDIYGKEIPGMMIPDLAAITLFNLGQMYPGFRSWALQGGGTVTETHTTRGWLKVYDSVNPPNRNTGISDIERFAKDERYLLGRLKGYVLCALFMRDTRGKRLDPGSVHSWLPGARFEGGVLCVSTFSGGGLIAGYGRTHHYPGISNRSDGFRLEEARKA